MCLYIRRRRRRCRIDGAALRKITEGEQRRFIGRYDSTTTYVEEEMIKSLPCQLIRQVENRFEASFSSVS